jgi:flavin reductase (DIM6/NTAB) family NADH-FMN oxidoreductase RutF
MGDHMMIVGEVAGFESSDAAALTYFRGRYGVAGGHTA